MNDMDLVIKNLRLPLATAANISARTRVYETLLSRQQGADVTMRGEAITKDHLQQVLPSLVADIAHGDETLASSAVKCLGFNLHQSNFAAAVGEAKVKEVVEALVALVTGTGSKVICSLGLWCLQGNSLPPGLVAPHVPGLVTAIGRAVDNPWGSVTCIYKAQLLTAKLVRQAPSEMKAHASVWGPKLVGTLLSEVKRVRDTGDEVLREAQAILAGSKQSLAEAITANVQPQYLARIMALAKAPGTEQAALTAWSWQVRLSGELLITKDMLINKLLPVLECTFGSILPAVREASFTAWRALIDVLTQPYVSTTRDALNSPPAKAGAGVKSPTTPKAKEGGHVAPSVRRLKLLMTPLLANLGQESEPQVRLACIRTWEYLLQRLAHWLKSSSVFQLIAEPVYKLILSPSNPTKTAHEKDPALYRIVLGQFLAFLGIRRSEANPSTPLKAAEQTGDGEEAVEVPWDMKQVVGLLEILGLVREQAVSDGSITALEVLQAAKAQEGRLEGPGPRSPASPLLPPAISGAAVDATGPKGLAGKRVGAPGPVTDEGHVSAEEALLGGWVALVRGVARAGRMQIRPSEEHVAAVRSLVTFVAETMSRVKKAGGQPLFATWQLVRVMTTELTSIVLASPSYTLPLPDEILPGGQQKAQSPKLSTPGAGKVGGAELFTPAAFLLAVTLANGSPLPEAVRAAVEPVHEEVKPGHERNEAELERVKGPVSELVELSCGRLDVMGGASRLVRVLEVLAGLQGSQNLSAPVPPPRAADVMLMHAWQEVAKQVTRFVVRSNDVPIAPKGAAGQAVFGVLILPLRLLGTGGLARGLGEGFPKKEGLDAALREWALLWEAAYRVTQLKNVQSNLLVQGFCSQLLRVVRSDLQTDAPVQGLFIHALSSCFSNLVSHLEIASSSSLAMSKKRRRVSTAPASATPPKDALLFLGKTFDDQNGVQDLAAILAHALHVAASHWSHPGGSNSLHTKTAAHPGVRESNVSELLSVLTSLLGKLLGQGDVLLVLQPLLSPLAQWLALTHSWKPALNFGSQPPESQPTQDVSPLLASLTTLWSQLLTALEKCHPPLEFDSQTLQTLSPLLEHSLAHSHQPIANRAVSFWESTFAKSGGNGVNGTLTNGTRGLTGPSHAKVSQGRSQTQGLAGELIYPAELVPILTRIRGKVDLPLPDWNGPDLPALEDGVKRPRDEEPALEHSKLGTEKLSERSLGNRAKLGLDDNEEGAKSGGVECKRSLVVGVLQSAVLGLELDICDGIVAGEGLKAADKGAEGSDGKLPSGKPGDGLDSTRMPPVGTRTLSGTEGRNDKGAEVVGAEAPPVASSKRRTSDGVKEEGSARLSVATTGSRGVANVDGKPGTDKRTPEAGKPTGAGPVPDTENRTSASLRGPAEGDPGLAAKLPVGDEGRTSERAERTPERDSKRVKVAGRPGSAEADGKKRRKLGFLEDTQDGEFVAIPFSPKRHKGPLTERQREARAEQQQQRRGVSTYTNLDASQAPWASETQDEEEPPVQLGAAGKSESVFGGEEARTGFEGFPTVTGVSGEALVGGGEMVTRNGGEGVLMENGHGTTALQGEVIEKAKEGDDEMEIEWQESKVAGASEDMPTGDKGSFFGAGGVSDRGGSTDPRGERQGSEKVEDAKVEESAVGKEEVERPEETDGAPKADVKATAGPSERSEGSPKKDEAGGVQPKAPARVEMGVCGDNDGGCAVMVAAQTLEQEPANRGEDEVPVRGSENRTMERSSPERKEEERSSAAAQAPKAEAPQLTRRGSEGSIPECRPVESTTFLSASTKATVGSPFVPERPEGGVGDGSVEAGLPTGGLPGVNALLNRENAAADGTVPASGPERSDTLPLPETQEGSRDEVRQLERAVDSACEAGDGGLKASDLYPGEKSLVASGGVVLNAADGKALETGAELTATKERADADTPAAETAPKSQPRVSQNPLSNPAVSAQAEQPALEAAAAAVPSDAQTLIHREFPTNVLSALPIANPTPKATLNPVSEQPLDPVPASAPDPTANPTANAAQEEGPNSNRAVNPAPEPMVKQNLNPASEPAVSGPVFPELVSSDAPVKNVLSNLPRSARQVLLAGAVCTVGDLAKMDCGELRKRMPIRAAVQTVRNALRAFRDREERRRANSQESPVVSQTPTDADDAPQPSDSDARIDGPDGRSHGIDGQDAPDEQKRSVPVEEEGQAEAEARVAETQESVRSSPRASRKRSAPDGFGFAPSDGIDEKRGKGEKESAVLEGMELKGESRWLDPVRGCDPPAGTETRGSVDGERRKKRCTGPEVEPTFEAAASGGEAQDENGREVAGKDRVPGDSGRELNPDTDGKAMLSGSELNGGAGRKGTTEGSFGVNLPGQMLVGSCDRSAAGLAEMAPGGKEPAETVTTGEKAVTNGLRSEPARLDWGGRGEEVAPLDPGKAAGGPEQGDPSRSQRAPWNDFRAGALVAHADGSPGGRRDPAAQLAVMSRSIAERAPEGMVTEKRPVTMAVKVQQLLTDPEWDTLDVVGLVEAQLFVSDLSSKIAACLRARAPDHFTRI